MALYCGIDLHSNNLWLTVLEGPHKVVRDKRLPNDLGTVIRELEPFRENLVAVAIESTWNWYWLVDGLKEAGFEVRLVNTSAVKQYEGKKFSDDNHDARWLAHLMALGVLPVGYIYPKDGRPVRDLLRRRAFLVRKRTSFLLSMRGAFECRTGMRVNSNDIKTWSPADVGAFIDDPVAALGIASLLPPIAVINEEIGILEKEALKRGRLRTEFKTLLTVWGIGKVLGLTIMYEVGDISRFAKVGNFASYCRCVRTARISNKKRKGSGNRKNGNPYLSWAFSEAAHFSIRHHEPAKKYYQRKKNRTNGIVAIRALAHKLARASYHVMTDRVDFDPERLFV